MVVTRSYQILLPKNDFLPFSHWYLHCNPKKVPTWEGKVVEQKQKQFWNQWSNGNNLGACPMGNSEIFSIRITLVPIAQLKLELPIWFGSRPKWESQQLIIYLHWQGSLEDCLRSLREGLKKNWGKVWSFAKPGGGRGQRGWWKTKLLFWKKYFSESI